MTPALARLRQVARPPLLAAGWRRSLPRLLMAALGALALAKLGLLAEDLLGRLGTGPQPVVEAGPIAPGVEPASVAAAGSEPEAPMPAAGPGPAGAAIDPGAFPAGGPGVTSGDRAAHRGAPNSWPGAVAAAPPAAAAASPEPPADASAAPDSSLDPSRLTASEIAILQQLAARGAPWINAPRARSAKARCSRPPRPGSRARSRAERAAHRIAAAIEQHDAAEDAKLKSLIKILRDHETQGRGREFFDRSRCRCCSGSWAACARPRPPTCSGAHRSGQGQAGQTELAKHTKLLRRRNPDRRPWRPRRQPTVVNQSFARAGRNQPIPALDAAETKRFKARAVPGQDRTRDLRAPGHARSTEDRDVRGGPGPRSTPHRTAATGQEGPRLRMTPLAVIGEGGLVPAIRS